MKVLKAKCKHCGKEISSMYQGQLDYNLKAHEIACGKKIVRDFKRRVKEDETSK